MRQLERGDFPVVKLDALPKALRDAMDVIDFTRPELRGNPHEIFAQLRREAPVCPIRGMRSYLITKYEDCVALLKSDQVGFEDLSSLEQVPEELKGYYEMRRNLMLFQNPPEHPVTRKAGERELQKCEAARLEEIIRKSAQRCLGRIDGEKCEFITEVARPFVAEVIAEILGMDGLDLEYVTELAQQLADSLDPLSEKNSRAAAGAQYLELRGHVHSGCPHAGDADLGVLVMLVAAGLQTTGHILGLAMRSLLMSGKLDSAQEISNKAVEELFRYHSPAQMTRRVVTGEVEVRGKTLHRGTVLWLALASANRDEDVFENSQELDFERAPNRHLAFGVGSHFCIGYKIARMQLKIFLEEYSKRELRLKVQDSHPEWNGNLLFKGLAKLPLGL